MDNNQELLPEAKFYNILCLYSSNKIQEAKALENLLDKNSWEFKELQKVFNK